MTNCKPSLAATTGAWPFSLSAALDNGGGPRGPVVPPVPKLCEGTDVQNTLNIAARTP